MGQKKFGLEIVLLWGVMTLAGCGGGSSPIPTVSVTVTPSATTVDGTDTVSLTAAVANDKNAAGVTWNVSGGGALSNTTTSTATYTAPAATTSAQSITVTATSIADPTKTSSTTLSVPAAPSITTTSSSLAGKVGNSYSVQLAAAGGISPYAWSVVQGSTLPAGLTLSTAGLLSGTPLASGSGTSSVAFNVKDSGTPTALTTSQTLSVAISAATAVTFTGTVPGTAVFQQAYTGGSAAATGGAGTLTYSISTGALPGGLTLSASTGAISGSPTATGTFPFTVKAADAYGDSATQNDQIVVNYPAMSITTATTLPTAYEGSSYSLALQATGGTGLAINQTWSLASGSSLPASLSLSAGTITGKPTATANTYSFAVTVTDTVANLSTTATLSLTIKSGIGITTTTLPPANAGTSYSQQLQLAGGSGVSDTWSATSSNLSSYGLSLSIGGLVSGTPTQSGTATFTAQVTDSASNTAQQALSIQIYSALVLPASPSTLPTTGTLSSLYSGTITAAGGSGSYSWSVSGLTDNLSATPGGTGNATLTISGTPNAAATVSFSITLTDTATNNSITHTGYTITVGSPTYQVSGNIYILNTCGTSTNMPQINVSINTSPTQTATTDSNGNFSFASVPNGSYTLTPSISAPSAIFSPTSLAVTVNGAAVTGQNYALQLAYNLSGYVSYTGSQTGRVYLWLADSCNSRQVGTSITAAQLTSGGAFTIHGVPPGSYTLWAKMDAQGNGFPINESFPVGKTTGVTVSTASITNATVAMSDPASYAITATPGLLAVSPMDLGVVVDYNAIIGTDSNGLQVEVPPYYQIQWSTSTSWPSPTTTNSYVFPASAGDGAGIVIMNNATSGVSGNPFTNGVPYYFRMRGYISSGNAGNGGWTYFGGSSAATATPVTIGTLAGANTVSGQVTFTGTAKGPLYVGFFSPSTGQMYGEHIASPVSPQSYTVQVPTGTGYYFVGIVDNNNDGLIDAGDFADTRGSGGPPLASISASQSGLNMVIPATNTVITVTTQNSKVTNPVTTFTNYGIYFDLRYSNNEPVAVQLLSGPNIVTPVDIARCSTCGAVQFQYGNGVPGSGPSVGDTYTFNITYIDGTSEQLTGTVATLLSAYATALIPQQTTFGVSTTPTFSWNYPTNASSYTYQLSLWDNSGNQIWQIPSSSTKSSGFTSTQIPSTSGGTGISWGVDPTNSSNKPTITTLTSGTTYNWSVETIDANGNTASRQIWFTP